MRSVRDVVPTTSCTYSIIRRLLCLECHDDRRYGLRYSIRIRSNMACLDLQNVVGPFEDGVRFSIILFLSCADFEYYITQLDFIAIVKSWVILGLFINPYRLVCAAAQIRMCFSSHADERENTMNIL